MVIISNGNNCLGLGILTQVQRSHRKDCSATVYLEDDEAHDIWETMLIDLPAISRLGKEHNYWEHGVGPVVLVRNLL